MKGYLDKLFFIIYDEHKEKKYRKGIYTRRSLRKQEKNCFLFEFYKKKVTGKDMMYYNLTNRGHSYCTIMKIFKRDPADIISLANFTNHSQWSTTGSHLPINFPSVVLVSGCPITSNNGHPRAIYRVCVRHECLQTERSSKQRS